MSRVDESRSEKRAEEARLAERRLKDQLQKQRSTEATAFDRALAQKSAEPTARAFREVGGRPSPADGPVTEPPREPISLDSAAAGDAPATELGAERTRESAQSAQRSFSQKLDERRRPAAPQPQPQMPRPQSGGPQGAGTLAEAKQPSTPAKEESADVKVDARTEDINFEVATGTVAGRKSAAARRAGDESGGSGGTGDTGSRGGGSKDAASNTAFRLPPAALMPPPPLARPRDAGGARLALMREVVDKIVSRVLVGTNAQGIPEFRLELKSSVLKGLSIKVSGGRGGKIRAVFSGGDTEVLAALKQSSQELVEALEARGLTLEELVIEAAEDR